MVEETLKDMFDIEPAKLTELIAQEEESEKFFKEHPDELREEDQGLAMIGGEPMLVVDGNYMAYDDAKIVFQKRKLLREYLRLRKIQALLVAKRAKLNK
jgi:hypothetical protein